MNLAYRTGFGFAGYLFIGTSAVLIPLTMPFIADEYMASGMALAAIGLIFPARSIGSILGNLFSGIASDLVGRWRLVWLAALAMAVALALTALAKVWLLFLLGFVLVSVAQGSLVTGINAMIADDHRDNRARALNTLHALYGAGAAVSPLIIGLLLDRGMAWRWALAGTGLIWLGYGLLAMLANRNSKKPLKKKEGGSNLDFDMLRQRPFLALFLIAFLYNAIAFSLLGWIAVFLRQTSDASTLLSVLTISLFYVALTSGRFICAAYTDRLGYARTLLMLAVGVVLTYPLVLLGMNILVMIGVFLVGLSLSGLFPTAMAFGSRLYATQTGTMSGTLNTALTLGGMLPPLWTGVIAGAWGFQVAFGVNYLMALPLVVLALYLGRVERAPSQESPNKTLVSPVAIK